MRFSADTLDLSRFPAPLAIRGIDFDAIMDARKLRLIEIFARFGIEYDLEALESDPAIIHAEADAYRELLAYARVNDAVRSVMVAFATGTDLDHLAAFYGIGRRVIVAATGSTPAVMESDGELRRRVLLAPEAFAAAGPAGAYAFHALSADPRVLNVDVWSPNAGEVMVAIQSREGNGLAPDDLVEAVRAHLARPDIKPLTDVLAVRSVTNHPFAVSLDAYVLPGPDPVAVKTEIEAAITAMAATRRTPSRDMPRSAVTGAAQIAVVDKVTLVTPSVDIAMGYGEVPVLSGMDVRVHTHG